MAGVCGRISRRLARWWWVLWLPAALAADPAGWLRITVPVQFHYQETRTLRLLADPWRGSGFMLADPDGTLVKLQLAPRRVLMIATPEELLYYDPGTGERRRLPLPAAVPQVEGIVLLQHLLRGELGPVRRRYRLDLREEGAGWRLTLTPRDPAAAPFRSVILRGDSDRRLLEITEPDADRSVIELVLDERGGHLGFSIARLRREAAGE